QFLSENLNIQLFDLAPDTAEFPLQLSEALTKLNARGLAQKLMDGLQQEFPYAADLLQVITALRAETARGAGTKRQENSAAELGDQPARMDQRDRSPRKDPSSQTDPLCPQNNRQNDSPFHPFGAIGPTEISYIFRMCDAELKQATKYHNFVWLQGDFQFGKS